MDRLIFHIDVNSAFLSWSAVKRLEEDSNAVDLRTIPSAVGGDVKTRHGVITAKSIPAKKFGIKTGEPVMTALRKCPDLVLVRSDFDTYRRFSHAFIEILETYGGTVEKASIDEAFLDLTEAAENAVLSGASAAASCTADAAGRGASPTDAAVRDYALETAQRIRDEIRTRLKFTVNVGISSNKLLAKMASDFEKPDKTHTLWPEEVPEKMWPLPIGSLFGCGGVSAERLRSFGIRTIGDAAAAELSILQAILGEKAGAYISRAARGISRSPVTSEREAAKSYSNETTTAEDISSQNYAEKVPPILRHLSEKVAARMQRDGVRALTIGVMVKTGEFRRHSRQITLPRSTSDPELILQTASELLHQLTQSEEGLFPRGQVLRLIGVSAANLDDNEFHQIGLFDWAREQEAKRKAEEKCSRNAREEERTRTADASVSRTAREEVRTRTADASVSRTARDMKLGRMMQELSRKFGNTAVVRGSELSPGDGGRKTENNQKRNTDEHTDL